MGQSLSSSWFLPHQPVFCICFTNLDSHLEPARVDVFTRLLNFLLFFSFFLPYLAKTETSVYRDGKWIAEIDNPLPTPTQSVWHTKKRGIPPLPFWLICSHSQWQLCDMGFSFFLCIYIYVTKTPWPYLCRWVMIMCFHVQRVRAGACVCAVRARTVELFGILTTVPCWQLL